MLRGRSCWRLCRAAAPHLVRLHRTDVGQIVRAIDPLRNNEFWTVIGAVPIFHRLDRFAGDNRKLAAIRAAPGFPFRVDILERVGEMDRVAAKLRCAAQKFQAIDHHHEAAPEPLSW